MVGRPLFVRWAESPSILVAAPATWPGCAESTNPLLSSPASLSAVNDRKEHAVRFVGMDVHQDFCEVAIAEHGEVRAAGRVKTSRAELELFAQSLGPDDQVALESTANALAIGRILKPHVARVVVANTKKLRQISQAKAKTDQIDARTLARLLASGFLNEVWMPDEPTRALRRWVSRRAQLVRQRTRAKNAIHAVLVRTLTEPPAASDLFGKAGRRWLADVELPLDERLTIDGCLRQIAFLDGELAAIEKTLTEQALSSPDMLRLMTVPGVEVVTAATFMALVGDITRFPSPRHLVGYLGLNPRVRQSGNAPARHGHTPKKAPRPVATCSAKRPGRRPARPGRCGLSPTASRPAAARTSPWSPSPASSA